MVNSDEFRKLLYLNVILEWFDDYVLQFDRRFKVVSSRLSFFWILFRFCNALMLALLLLAEIRTANEVE